MKIEIEGTKTNKKELWVDGYYVDKIDEDHFEVDENDLDYLELHPISYFLVILKINGCVTKK